MRDEIIDVRCFGHDYRIKVIGIEEKGIRGNFIVKPPVEDDREIPWDILDSVGFFPWSELERLERTFGCPFCNAEKGKEK